MASRSASKSAASTGKRPQKTTGLRGLEARQRAVAGLAFVGDGVADAGVADLLDRGREDADFAGAKFGDVDHLRAQHGQLVDAIAGAGLHHLDRSPFFTPSMMRIITTTPR
jgi:hypothetical protein